MAAPSDEQDELLQKLRRLVNASGEKEDTFGSEMADDARVWRVYAKAARKHDGELLAQWNGTLDTLLIFAGLFSAVSTTFIIDSYKQMQPDYAQETFRLLLANSSGAQYVEPSNHIAESARAVNCLWISSLIASLSTALIAILAKQWLASYPVSDRENLREWAQLRQYRFDALQLWHMPVLIAVVPVLLHVSLMLFLAGLVVFLGAIDTGIMILALVLSAATYSLYGFTTLSPVLWSSSPFRTPLTPVLHRISHRNSLVGKLLGVMQGLYSAATGATRRLYRTTVRIGSRVGYSIGKVMVASAFPTLLSGYAYGILFVAVHTATHPISELYSLTVDTLCHLCNLCCTAGHSVTCSSLSLFSTTSHRLARDLTSHYQLSARHVDPWITQTAFSSGVAACALSWLGLNAETTDIYYAVLGGLGDTVSGSSVAGDLSLSLKSRISVQTANIIPFDTSREFRAVVLHLRASYNLRSLPSSRHVTAWVSDSVNAVRPVIRTQGYLDTVLRVSTILESHEDRKVSFHHLTRLFAWLWAQDCESPGPSSILPSTVHSIVQFYIDFRDQDGFGSHVLHMLNALQSYFVASPDLAANLLRCLLNDDAEDSLTGPHQGPRTAGPTHRCGKASCEVKTYLAIILSWHRFGDWPNSMTRHIGIRLKTRTFETFALFCRAFPDEIHCSCLDSTLTLWLSGDNPFSQISLCARDITAFMSHFPAALSRSTRLRLIRHLLHPDQSWCREDLSDAFRDNGLDACLHYAPCYERNMSSSYDLAALTVLLDDACLEPLQRAPTWNESTLLTACATTLTWANYHKLDVEDLVSKFFFREVKGEVKGRLDNTSIRTWDLVIAGSQQILSLAAEPAHRWWLHDLCLAFGDLRRRYPHKARWKEMGDRVRRGANFLYDPAWKARNPEYAVDVRMRIEGFCGIMDDAEFWPGAVPQELETNATSRLTADASEMAGNNADKVLEWQIDGAY